MTSVLYDAPGPRAKARNWIYTGVFLLASAALAWWVLSSLADKGQLDADKWTPFVEGQVWTTFLLPGLWETLKAGAIAMVIALPLGALLGLGRLSDHAWVRTAVGAWVEFFRAIPVLMLMLFGSAFFVQYTTVASEIRPLYAVITGLVLYNSAVIGEIVRAGVDSLPKGQTDAAKAIGMRKGQVMTYVLLPQAVTAMLPALVSQLVVILKDTAIGGAVLGFAELLTTYRQISANYSNIIPTLIVIAAIYIAVNFALTTFASWLEGRLRKSKRTTDAIVPITLDAGNNSAGM
ncbi:MULTISPECIES: amino acid ABC transporter permease [unclassified Streptomyces]|uniref:amino acid ABC transporter permease n=1 Tax=unclassified Streptomyces TaxID=2593676 RepID=UPI002030D5DC|nr:MULTISPECIES: amino acid ABC transporter permease [unclassified Streptomyces]MCM1977123.1 amino acid ABC transporter permease [Streptomyces sp. G1]MCX5127131.1 amino acid ABC transporter permease [Streptomyces sp. NBC_00347]MCX5295436.1 amino acid ABC transporter permease [Streptomyces sp. NBC_00193]